MTIDCTILGCGTAGYWLAHELMCSAAGAPAPLLNDDRILGLRFADCAPVKKTSPITCPLYAGHVGTPKATVLADLARRWTATAGSGGSGVGGKLTVSATVSRVADLDYRVLLGDSASDMTVALMGLDNWTARLTVAKDLRVWACESRKPTVLLSTGVDKGFASVAIYDCGAPDPPCPACGLGNSLPDPAPCIVLNQAGEPVRGDLHVEAAAAGAFIRDWLAEALRTTVSRAIPRVNTRAVIALANDGTIADCHSHAVARDFACLGIHGI